MLKADFVLNKSNFYFIGIGGIGMSAIAKHLLSLGKTVSGSDKCKTDDTQRLADKGIKVFYTQNPARVLSADAVIYTSAVSNDDEELSAAINNGVPVYKRSEILGAIMSAFRYSIGVSGSHGKTTVTAMITEILKCAGCSPTAFIGGKYRGENYLAGEKDYCVAEACEYMANFLDLSPKMAVITNIADDHLDYYGDRKNLLSAFSEFAHGKTDIVNIDGVEGFVLPENAVTVGIKSDAHFRGVKLKKHADGGYSFALFKGDEKQGRVRLKIAGRHNVENALCALAAASEFGVDFKTCKNALESFCGVERRMEYLGEICGVKAYADYAHHPDEITATLSAFNGKNPLVVFQPHTYSRTRLLKEKFISALTGDFTAVIYKTYPAREKFDADGSAYSLFKTLSEREKCFYCSTETALKKTVEKNAAKRGAILFLGAGDIYEIAKKIVKER